MLRARLETLYPLLEKPPSGGFSESRIFVSRVRGIGVIHSQRIHVSRGLNFRLAYYYTLVSAREIIELTERRSN